VDHAEFGRYLAQQRELRGMTREDVAERTKIAISLLQALENGETERLPERVFVVNYVRAYAEVIGLAPDEVALRYEEIDAGSNTAPSPVELERHRRGRALRILWVLGGALIAAAAAFAWWGRRGG
jgi:cytoskeletal protein RodZ